MASRWRYRLTTCFSAAETTAEGARGGREWVAGVEVFPFSSPKPAPGGNAQRGLVGQSKGIKSRGFTRLQGSSCGDLHHPMSHLLSQAQGAEVKPAGVEWEAQAWLQGTRREEQLVYRTLRVAKHLTHCHIHLVFHLIFPVDQYGRWHQK